MAPDLNSLPPSPSPRNTSPSLPRTTSPQVQQTSQHSSNSPILNPASRNSNNATPPLPPPRGLGSTSPQIDRTRAGSLRRTVSGSGNSPRSRNHSGGYPQAPSGMSGGGHDASDSRTSSPVATMFPSHSSGLRGDPGHRQRAPSLGEVHQELESEGEAQVNRLLSMIREQQSQIAAHEHLRHAENPQHQHAPSSSSAIAGLDDDHATSASTAGTQTTANAPLSAFTTSSASTPGLPTPSASTPSSAVSSRPASLAPNSATLPSSSQPHAYVPPPPATATHPMRTPSTQSLSQSRRSSSSASGTRRIPSYPHHPSGDFTRRDSRGNVYVHDPASGLQMERSGSSRGRERERDELSLLQTEAAMVGRENVMLRGRIRELEAMLEGLKGAESPR